MIRLALLRHGPTAWNRAGRIQGRSDIPLDDAAREALRGLALPVAWRAAMLCASPLSRATETASLLTGADPLRQEALIEMDWGQWEGQRAMDLHADPGVDYRPIESWGWDYRPPGGESPADLRARLGPWAAALRQDTLAVCHIGVMRVLLAMATGWNFDGPAPFVVKRNRLYLIGIDGDRMTALPDTPRLEPRMP